MTERKTATVIIMKVNNSSSNIVCTHYTKKNTSVQPYGPKDVMQ
jgi:hypothetical protein